MTVTSQFPGVSLTASQGARSTHRSTIVGAHIPELDGVRGLAIFLVLGFHFFAFVPGIPGVFVVPFRLGWSGVDLFFVLSGALITGILIDTRHTSNYFSSFYVRRCLRILPLYFTCVLLYFHAALPIAHAFGKWTSANNSLELWYWGHLSNWRSAFGYDVPVLTHFWSLAIEEQFYLCWPLLVYVIRPAWLPYFCGGMILTSFGLRCAYVHNGFGPEFIYRLTPFRVEPLAWGAVVAIIVRHNVWSARIRRILGLLVATGALLLIGILCAEKPLGSHGSPLMDTFGFTAFAIIYSSLVLAALIESGSSVWFARQLRRPIATTFGKYSYGIYVFHLPIMRGEWQLLLKASKTQHWMRYMMQHIPFAVSLLAAVFGIGLAYIAARISWFLLEKRFLRFKDHFVARQECCAREELVVNMS